jgi:hypothetical protein
LYWIYHFFHPVLGKDLSFSLQNAIRDLLNISLKYAQEMPIHYRLRIAGAAIACGKQWNQTEWVESGQALLSLEALWIAPSRFIPAHLGDCLTGLLLGGGVDLPSVLKWMRSLWHSHLKCYGGPFEQVNFIKGQQEITLYDFYMSAEDKILSPRIRMMQPALLHAALVFPVLDRMEAPFPPLISQYRMGPNYCFSWIEKSCTQRKNYPFVFQWGSHEEFSLFVLLAPLATGVSFDGKETFNIHLGNCPDPEAKEEAKEIVCYFTEKPGLKMFINGVSATTFRQGDLVTIEDDKMKFELKFHVENGIFQGHLSKGSVPTEKANFGKNRFEVYQWQLFWRTISRVSPCLVTLSFRYYPL